MTAASLVAGLRRGGFQVRVSESKLVVSPRSRPSGADRAALAEHRVAILNLLQAEGVATVAGGRCGLCGGVLAWVEGWPALGVSAWLCSRCASRAAPTLAEVFAELTAQSHRKHRSSYQAVSNALVDARKEGFIPWEWIEDRLRRPGVAMWSGFADFAETAVTGYRRERLDDPTRVRRGLAS